MSVEVWGSRAEAGVKGAGSCTSSRASAAPCFATPKVRGAGCSVQCAGFRADEAVEGC